MSYLYLRLTGEILNSLVYGIDTFYIYFKGTGRGAYKSSASEFP